MAWARIAARVLAFLRSRNPVGRDDVMPPILPDSAIRENAGQTADPLLRLPETTSGMDGVSALPERRFADVKKAPRLPRTVELRALGDPFNLIPGFIIVNGFPYDTGYPDRHRAGPVLG